MNTTRILFPAAFVALILAPGVVGARHASLDAAAQAPAQPKDELSKEDRAILRTQRWSYPLATCPISGEELGKDAVDFVVAGRMVRTCCNGCKADVLKDPKPTIAKIDAAVIAKQKPSYPLATCPVTGEKLDDKAVDHVHGTRLVRLANHDAVAAFTKDPKPPMAKVDAAYIQALAKTYPLKTCVVSGEELGGMGEPEDRLYGVTLVRFCCAGCTSTFEKEPDKYLAKIAAAAKAGKDEKDKKRGG